MHIHRASRLLYTVYIEHTVSFQSKHVWGFKLWIWFFEEQNKETRYFYVTKINIFLTKSFSWSIYKKSLISKTNNTEIWSSCVRNVPIFVNLQRDLNYSWVQPWFVQFSYWISIKEWFAHLIQRQNFETSRTSRRQTAKPRHHGIHASTLLVLGLNKGNCVIFSPKFRLNSW